MHNAEKILLPQPLAFGGGLPGQALTHHPHIHCLVPGGALSPDGRLLGCRPNFFLPIRVLSRRFQRLFLERLQAAHAAGQLRFSGGLDSLGDAEASKAVTRKLRRKHRVVCPKPPFGPPEDVLFRTRPRLSRPLHSPGCHGQKPPDPRQRYQRDVPLA